MLNSIRIQNYRNLKDLSIEKFGRVNLIIGKNNTGKTSLLEAIYLLLHPDVDQSIAFILRIRGEFFKTELNQTTYERLVSTIKALFHKKTKKIKFLLEQKKSILK
ncbi:AAA family ATPase [Dyadobacter sp. NIV53]|uniref:AAA family ATPase n=1 Tax=Dyadobacter sp. NIV53 TaxID=2861765 RepID=UPI001C845548|nr:AAA family ATPase [Dyadobacter sp. NIV53]